MKEQLLHRMENLKHQFRMLKINIIEWEDELGWLVEITPKGRYFKSEFSHYSKTFRISSMIELDWLCGFLAGVESLSGVFDELRKSNVKNGTQGKIYE